MTPNRQTADATLKLVQPRAIKNYAKSLGWKPVDGVNGSITVLHDPNSELHQLVIPLDETLDDYEESIREVIQKLAAFDRRSFQEVLDHLLLPPADVLRFRESSADAESGSLSLDQGLRILEGARGMILAQAHSEIAAKPYHPRLSRSDAGELVRRCRLGQTERGSFILTIACPIEIIQNSLIHTDPYTRRVTQGVIESLSTLIDAADSGVIDDTFDRSAHPKLSANFCEAFLLLRPTGDRSYLSVSPTWSKAIPAPTGHFRKELHLGQECFEAAESIASKLRVVPESKPDAFVGVVEVLRGQPDEQGATSGEVIFSLLIEGAVIRAKAELAANEYQIAGTAHLKNLPVYCRGCLIRSSRSNRLTDVSDLKLIEPNSITDQQPREREMRVIDFPEEPSNDGCE